MPKLTKKATIIGKVSLTWHGEYGETGSLLRPVEPPAVGTLVGEVDTAQGGMPDWQNRGGTQHRLKCDMKQWSSKIKCDLFMLASKQEISVTGIDNTMLQANIQQ